MPPIYPRPPKIGADLRRGEGVAITGDSIAEGSGSGGGVKYLELAWLLMDSPLPLVVNAGAGGETVQEVMARLSTDVIPYRPAYCFVQCGTNNGPPEDVDDVFAVYESGLDTLRNNRIEPILCLMPPHTGVTALTDIFNQTFRALQRDLAVRRGYAVVDAYSPAANKLTAEWASGRSDDNVHPNKVGAREMADRVAADFADFFPRNGPLLVGRATSARDISVLTGGNVDTATGGVATGWTLASSGGTVTPSIVTGADGVKWQKISVSSAPASMSLNKAIPNLVAGNELEVSFRMTTENNVSGNGGFLWRIEFANGSMHTFWNYFPFDVTDKVWSGRCTVPTGASGTGGIRFSWQAGTFDLSLAQITVIDRTALGVV